MIRVKVFVGPDAATRIDQLYKAVRGETRVWSMNDLRRRKNLVLAHTARNVKGTVRRVKSADPEWLEFECKARDETQEAITAGRFVHLVLRYMPAVKDLSIHRAR